MLHGMRFFRTTLVLSIVAFIFYVIATPGVRPDRVILVLVIFLAFVYWWARREQTQIDARNKERGKLGLKPYRPPSDLPWILLGIFVGVIVYSAFNQALILALPIAIGIFAFGVWRSLQHSEEAREKEGEARAAIEEKEREEQEEERIRACEEILIYYTSVHLPMSISKLRRKIDDGITPKELKDLIEAALAGPDAPVSLGHTFKEAEDGEVQARPVLLDRDLRHRHVYAIGQTGAGKTNFLLTQIIQDIRAGHGLAVLTPDSDLLEQVLAHMPEHRYDDVIYFDPSDTKRPVCFNPLSLGEDEDIDLRADENLAAFSRTFEITGQRMEQILIYALYALLERPGSTLLDVERLLSHRDPSLRNEIVADSKDSKTVAFFRDLYPSLPKNAHQPITLRIDRLIKPRYLRNVICNPTTTLDFPRVMDEGRIALFNLSETVGENASQLLGQLIVSKFQLALMSRALLSPTNRQPFFLYVDEFQTFVGVAEEAYQKILDRARKYRMGLVLAHQHTGQLSNELLRGVLGNAYTKLCFTVAASDASRLGREFGKYPERLMNLRTGRAYCKVGREVNFVRIPLVKKPPSADARAGRAKERARRNWGTTVEESIEAEPLAVEKTTPAAEIKAPPAEVETVKKRRRRIRPDLVKPAKEISAQEQPIETNPVREEEEVEEILAEAEPGEEILFEAPPEPEEPVSEPEPVAPLPSAPPSPGRGGRQHKYLQDLIKRWGNGKGYKATVEQEILDGMGSVDVALEKGDLRIACEICVNSTPEQEVKNIQKCLAAGFTHVVSLSARKRTLADIEAATQEAITDESLAQVHFLTPEDFFELVENLEAEAGTTEDTIRGYKVKTRYQAVDDKDRKARRDTISRIISKGLSRFKD